MSKAALGAQFVDVYHGTTSKNAPKILKTGLRPAEGQPDVATVSHDAGAATWFAHDAADYYGGKPVVMHYRVPSSEWSGRFRGGKEGRGYGLREPLPAQYHHATTELEKRPGGYYR